jgi:hypothetical protein
MKNPNCRWFLLRAFTVLEGDYFMFPIEGSFRLKPSCRLRFASSYSFLKRAFAQGFALDSIAFKNEKSQLSLGFA